MQTICTSLQTDNHTNTSLLIFLRAGCSSRRPTDKCQSTEGMLFMYVENVWNFRIWNITLLTVSVFGVSCFVCFLSDRHMAVIYLDLFTTVSCMMACRLSVSHVAIVVMPPVEHYVFRLSARLCVRACLCRGILWLSPMAVYPSVLD